MENKEVSAHSAFLYFVFKPFQTSDDSYDYGNLKELLKILLKLKGVEKTVDEYKCIDICREVVTEFGRLDFLITADEDIFVIELKVWANEQPDQIPRYKEYLVKHGADENNIFFLTPLKRSSKTGESINITLKEDIRQAMEAICELRKDNIKYSTMIEQYISIINKLAQGEDYMRDTLDVIKKGDDIKAVELLINNRVRCLQQIMIDFFTKLADKLTDTIEIAEYPVAKRASYASGSESIKGYYKGKKFPALAYEIANCNLKSECLLKENIKLYFFIEIESNLYCGITPRKVSGDENNDLTYVHLGDAVEPYQALADEMGGKLKESSTFMYWEYLTFDKANINFTMNELNGNASIIRLLKKDSLEFKDNLFDELVSQIKKIYADCCKKIFKS